MGYLKFFVPYEGRNVVAAEISRITYLNFYMQAKLIINNVLAPLSFWSSVGIAFALTGFMGGTLTALGLASGLAGLFVLNTIVLAKAALNTAQEIRARSDIFEAIDNSARSPIQKLFAKSLEYAKCFGAGFLRVIISDPIYKKVNSFNKKGVKSVTNIAQEARDAFRLHPSKDTLDSELNTLSTLTRELIELQKLIQAQIRDKRLLNYDLTEPVEKDFKSQSAYEQHMKVYNTIKERAQKIEKFSLYIESKLTESHKELKDSSRADSRWKQGVNKELQSIEKVFKAIKTAIHDVNLAQKTELKLQSQSNAPEKIIRLLSMKTKEQHQRALTAAKRLTGDEGRALLSSLQEQTSEQAEALLKDLAQEIEILNDAAQKANGYYQDARQAAKKLSGAESFFIAVPHQLSTVCSEVYQAWQQVVGLTTEVNELITGIKKHIEEDTGRLTLVELDASAKALREEAQSGSHDKKPTLSRDPEVIKKLSTPLETKLLASAHPVSTFADDAVSPSP